MLGLIVSGLFGSLLSGLSLNTDIDLRVASDALLNGVVEAD